MSYSIAEVHPEPNVLTHPALLFGGQRVRNQRHCVSRLHGPPQKDWLSRSIQFPPFATSLLQDRYGQSVPGSDEKERNPAVRNSAVGSFQMRRAARQAFRLC